MKRQPLNIPSSWVSATEGGGGERRAKDESVGERDREHSPTNKVAAAAEGGGSPDGPRPIRPHPSAAHADQRRARHDGRARPRTSSLAAASFAPQRKLGDHTRARQAGRVTRHLLIRVLAPSSRNKAPKTCFSFHLDSPLSNFGALQRGPSLNNKEKSPARPRSRPPAPFPRDHAPARPPAPFPTACPLVACPPAASVTIPQPRGVACWRTCF